MEAAGLATASAPIPMFWQSAFTTKSGTLIEWGTGDHNPQGDNGVREFNPLTGSQQYVYANNNGSSDVTQYDNLQYWYIPRIDSLVIPSRGQFSRATRTWTRGGPSSRTFWPTGPLTVGEGSGDLIRPLPGSIVDPMTGLYNAHQAWSERYDAGVLISGGWGGDNTARQVMYLVVPSSGIGSYAQPYVAFERAMPASVGGVAAHLLNGRDGCCFNGEYVYWVGGEQSVSRTPVPYFFRMWMPPHLSSTTAPLTIERLPDLPAAASFPLLRSDPFTRALLCVSSEGIFGFDLDSWMWVNLTPQAYRDSYAPSPTDGKLPRGCLGDFVDAAGSTSLRKFYWRPGMNHDWSYDYGGQSTDRMYKRFRSIKLARRP